MKRFCSSSRSVTITVRARARAADLGKWADRLHEALHDGLLSLEQWQRAIAWCASALAKARKRLASFVSLACLREEAHLSYRQFSAQQAALVNELLSPAGDTPTNMQRELIAGVILDATLDEAQDAAYRARYLGKYMEARLP